MSSTRSVKVWLRPAGAVCKIRVSGEENARWLCERLTEREVQCTTPMKQGSTDFYVFRAEYPRHIAHAQFEELIKSLSEVELMLDPA